MQDKHCIIYIITLVDTSQVSVIKIILIIFQFRVKNSQFMSKIYICVIWEVNLFTNENTLLNVVMEFGVHWLEFESINFWSLNLFKFWKIFLLIFNFFLFSFLHLNIITAVKNSNKTIILLLHYCFRNMVSN